MEFVGFNSSRQLVLYCVSNLSILLFMSEFFDHYLLIATSYTRAEKDGVYQVDALHEEKDQLVRTVMPEFASILEKEKRMQVCEVCGAMQASTDTEKRLASHLEGKQHLVC